MSFTHTSERHSMFAMVRQLVVAAQRARSFFRARDTERALHTATDHADLKRLMDAQQRGAAERWWPAAG